MALQENALCQPADVIAAISVYGVDAPELPDLERLINAASDYIETYCRRTFRAEDGIIERHPASSRINLGRPPLRHLARPEDTYVVVNAAAGVLEKGCCPSSRPIEIEYDGGFETIPAGIVDACIRLVVSGLSTGALDDLGITSAREGNVSATRSLSESPPPSVKATLRQYRLAGT